ncbi:TetR/AcrR family transcriptional regulator [Pseudomonas japonica]|uniref:TetR/AcrR family transcriptional regulator n=1 Tax=Pseudomonas japonica TaxID=256466 RepID=UPI0038291542
MSGLRGRQKEKRRKAIADAALALFEAQGYQGTTVEQIAAKAEVGVTTVFNYFGTKQQIILEILRQDDELAYPAVVKRLKRMSDPVEAMTALGVEINLHTLRALPLSVWREVLPLMFSPGSVFYDAYQELVRGFMEEARSALQMLIDRGVLSSGLDVQTCIQVCMDVSHMELLRLVAEEQPDPHRHEQYMRAATRLLLGGAMCSGT